MGKYKGIFLMDKDIICNFENLYKAYRKAKAGKGFNGSCAKFQNMSAMVGVFTPQKSANATNLVFFFF